jgi:hypothetical protein
MNKTEFRKKLERNREIPSIIFYYVLTIITILIIGKVDYLLFN